MVVRFCACWSVRNSHKKSIATAIQEGGIILSPPSFYSVKKMPNKALQPTAKSAAAERDVRCLIERRYLVIVCHALKREREAQYSDSGVGR